MATQTRINYYTFTFNKTQASTNIYQGPQGPQGFVGQRGIAGVNGINGTQGERGPQGYQGPQGPFNGPQGYQGPQGEQGIRGYQGFQGTQGFQGPVGFQGQQGFVGEQGIRGYQGFQGAQGPQGAQGTKGFQGSQGFQGPQGTKGDRGPQGYVPIYTGVDKESDIYASSAKTASYLNSRIDTLSSDNVTSTPKFIGKYIIDNNDYPIYESSILLSTLPNNNQTIVYTLSDKPLGFGLYTTVCGFVVKPKNKSITHTLKNDVYSVGEIYVDSADLKTKIRITSNSIIQQDADALLTFRYVEDYGEFVEFQIHTQLDESLFEIEFPDIKYNKSRSVNLIFDNTASTFNNVFSVINKRWVDDEKYSFFNQFDQSYFNYHLDSYYAPLSTHYYKTTGHIPETALFYKINNEIEKRYSYSTAVKSNLIGLENEIFDWTNEHVSAKELRLFSDFGNTINTIEVGDVSLMEKLTDSEPKIAVINNDDCDYDVYNKMQLIVNTGNNNADKELVSFNEIGTRYIDDSNIILKAVTVDEFTNTEIELIQNSEHNVFLVNNASKATKCEEFLNLLKTTFADDIIVCSVDETYEHLFKKAYTRYIKNSSNGIITFKMYVPSAKNFKFSDVSFNLTHVLNENDTITCESCVGLSYSTFNTKTNVYVNYDMLLIPKINSYIAKNNSINDINYFVQQLKPLLRTQFE